jgi:Amt family ammonium transporter
LVAVLWALVVFSLAFGDSGNALIGNLDHFGLVDVTGPYGGPDGTFPFILFAAFQMTFAVITPALISGAVADRMKFAAWAWFIGIWVVLVYAPVAHWVWGGGWIAELGALDFAGGAVVHMNAGAAALAAVLVIGKRKGWPGEAMPPHSLPLTLLGAGILMFGWFGFNAGSALASDGIAAQAFINTFLAASAAMLGWLVVERLKSGHPTTLGAASGVVAGLVAITPCAGFVEAWSSMVIGAIAGGLCFLALSLKFRLGYDDSLDVVGVHLVGGLVGSLLLGLFATDTVNELVVDEGLFIGGDATLLGYQAIASFATLAFSFVVSFVIIKVLDMVMGVRVTDDDEDAGLDTTQHAETAYSLAGRS